MEKPSFFERANNWIKNSITLRIFTIGFLILLLLIPVNMVQDLIQEREYRKHDAVIEVSDKWSKEQTILGLVLTVPYNEYSKKYSTTNPDDYTLVTTRKYAHFFPEDLNISGDVVPEIRYRGIYKVVVYQTQLAYKGNFSKPDFTEWKIPEENIIWDEAFVSLGVEDLRGIEKNLAVQWNDTSIAFNPGLETKIVISNGISARVPILKDVLSYNFSFNLDLKGSSELSFVPLGKSTKVDIRSSWATPSFIGSFLPDNRSVSDSGFTATWEVLHLNLPYPSKFTGSTTGLASSVFGVTLMVPVDEYQKSMRSAKYAAMFITLTFIIIFFAQIMNRVRVHPIQYIIIGLALCVFYTLLIGLSEYIPFGISYLISSVAIISMISLYSLSIFKTKRITALMGLLMTVLYVFIFTIVQMEDFALLMGSIGLFIVLSVIMFLSRKLDWYNINKE